MIPGSRPPRALGRPRMECRECAPTLRLEIAGQCARRDVHDPTQHHEIDTLHRFGHFFAQHYRQVDLADIAREHVSAFLDRQKATFPRFRPSVGALYQLFEDAQAGGRFPPDVSSPVHTATRRPISFTKEASR